MSRRTRPYFRGNAHRASGVRSYCFFLIYARKTQFFKDNSQQTVIHKKNATRKDGVIERRLRRDAVDVAGEHRTFLDVGDT